MGSRTRILIVDDDPFITRALDRTLQDEGYTIVTANGGQAGIDAFRAALANNEPFAVVITDLGMDYIDGRQVAAVVKHHSPSTPVILLTGWGPELDGNTSHPLLVDCIVAKPAKLGELRAALARCLKNGESFDRMTE